MAITDGATLRKLLREDPDEALKVLQHDLFGMISVIQGGALLISEDLQQSDGYVLKGIETTRQVAELVLHEAMNTQRYLEELRGETATEAQLPNLPDLPDLE